MSSATKCCQPIEQPESVHLTENELRLAEMLKAVANPTRLFILKHLAACQPCICGDIVATLPLAQSTVSQHLKVLKEAGLVSGDIDGTATCYCVNTEALEWLQQQLADFVHRCKEQDSSSNIRV